MILVVRDPSQGRLSLNESFPSSSNTYDYDSIPNKKRQRSIKSNLFLRLPDELIDQIGKSIQSPTWPPPHRVFTDWSQIPSPEAQRDLRSLVRVCRRFYRIMMPMLMYEVEHNFDNRDRARPLPYPIRYQWFQNHQLWPSWYSIRVLHLRDLSHYVEPPVPMKGLLNVLSPLEDKLEVLVATGYCASILLETIPLRPTFKLNGLVTLKLFVYTLNVHSIYSVYNSCPNLKSLALNVMNLKQSPESIPPNSVSITQLDLGTRLYLEPECIALRLILRPLIPNLQLVNIHGEFHDGLTSVLATLNQSPLTHLALCFRNCFPRSFMAIHFPNLHTLSISTYARPMNHLWSSPLLHSITHLSLRTSGLPEIPKQIRISSSLQKLKLQSLGPPWDDDEEWEELGEIRDWCKKMKIDLLDCSHQSRTIESTDAYDELFNWKDVA